MEMTVQEYAKKLEAGEFVTGEDTVTGTKIQQKNTLLSAIQVALDNLGQGQLSQYTWTVNTRGNNTVTIRLETNLINIPMEEGLRLDGKLLDADEKYPVNLYLVAESPDVNRTGLRIDSLADHPDDQTDASDLAAKAQVWVAEKLALMAQNRKEAKAKAAKAKKTAAKKTTGRKTASKKTTKKKSAGRKKTTKSSK